MSTLKSYYFPEKEFASKEDLFKDLKANLPLIMDLKTKTYLSHEKGLAVKYTPLLVSKFSIDEQKALKLDDSYYYVVMNTTKVLDSHEDLHINGLWKKSVQEKQFKNYVTADHKLETLSIAVRKEHVEMFTAIVPFSALGYSYEGNTEALIYKFPKDKVQIPLIKEWLDSGDSIEGSVRMKYIKFLFCMDSNDPDDVEFKKNYDKYYDQIANKNDFDYIPYYFAILEASNEKESALVPYGSNSVTGNKLKKEEPTEVTPNIEAEKSLQIEKQEQLLKELLNKF